MSKVKVYRFNTYDGSNDTSTESQRMATRAFIEKFKREAIEGSELEVDSSQVDAEGKTEKGFTGH